MAKKFISSLLIILCACIPLGARVKTEFQKQSSPNLSGTWKLNKSTSSFLPAGIEPKMNLTLVISHVEPEIKVTYKFTENGQERIRERVYYSDGRGETNPPLSEGSAEIKSTTKWSGDKLILKYKFEPKTPKRDLITTETFEEWKLSSDGRTLTQTIKQYMTGGPSVAKPLHPTQVYKKVFIRIS